MILVAAAVSVLAAAAPPSAQTMPPSVLGVALLPGWRDDTGAHVAAIEIRMAPGWHTYWRAPGAAGVPPRFDWSGSENLGSVSYEWPTPAVFESFGAVSIGYADRFVLPVRLTPKVAHQPIEASVDVSFGVCKEICIPAEARVSARLEAEPARAATARQAAARSFVGGAAPAAIGADADALAARASIERALADRPLDAASAGVTGARCVLGAGASGATLTAEVEFARAAPKGATAVIEAGDRPDLWIGEAETLIQGRRLMATAPLEAAGGAIALDRSALRVTLIEPGRAVDIKGCPAG